MSEKSYEWKTVGNGDQPPSKIVATFTRVLPDDDAKACRDQRVMDYLRAMSKYFEGRPFSCAPAELCELWEWAFFAGQDHAAETIKDLKEQLAAAKAPKISKKK